MEGITRGRRNFEEGQSEEGLQRGREDEGSKEVRTLVVQIQETLTTFRKG